MARSKPKSEVQTQAATDILDTPEDAEKRAREHLPELVNPSPVVPSEGPTQSADPVAGRYRVEAEKKIMHRGTMTVLRMGKVIRSTDYNVEDLAAQGVKLTKLG